MTLLERLRAALSADYEVHDEIGRGGMGAVFRATDPALGRYVAIKVLLPERATAQAVERFVREGRALAAVDHPCVLRVHRAGEAEGLFYYVMEHVEGETLADRLRGGPLGASEWRKLASDLLEALAAVHDAGIVHRDVKPSNIFLAHGRALLGDFGIASPVASPDAERLTSIGEVVGTVAYQAPEQRLGQDATRTADIYSAGLVLYEACTGTTWHEAAASGAPWAKVPRRLRAPLRRAMRPVPGDRWTDARAFARAVARAGSSRARYMALAGVVLAAVALALLMNRRSVASPSVGDLAVLPFDVVGATGDGTLGHDLAVLTTLDLEGLPGLRVIPASQAARVPPGRGPLDPEVRRALRAVYVARGTIRRRGDRLELHLAVDDSFGERLPERVVMGVAADPFALADSVALALVRQVAPRLASSFRGLEALSTTNLQALREFLLGEHAFHRNAWVRASEHYQRALDLDSSFTLAAWRLWNVWRWQLTGREVVDLPRLSREHGQELAPVDRTLLAAEALPPGPTRIAALEEATRRYGYDAYAWLLLGDELYNRGPLVGRSLREAAAALSEAAARDPQLGPAYEESMMVLTRLGLQEKARVANERLQATAAPPAPNQPVYFPALLDQAYRERFEPEEAARVRERLFDASDPRNWSAMAFAARMGLALDVPEAQLEVGRRLAASGAPISTQADGQTAQALALMVLGRPTEALVHFDSAAVLMGSPEMQLESAEWRVVFPALGIVALPGEGQHGREHLREIFDRHRSLAGRAAWALSLDADATGDASTAEEWRSAVQDTGNDTESSRLQRLAQAFEAQTAGRYRHALTLSEPLLKDQFLPRRRDPFTRTVLHLIRAQAFEALGDADAARRERVWADNEDIAQLLGGLVQAVEVDWAAGPYSDRIRARLNLVEGDTAEACRLLDRIARLWRNAEPQVTALRAESQRLREAACL
ncbi:MAG: protein kinase [Gemmatimonadota bacterium]